MERVTYKNFEGVVFFLRPAIVHLLTHFGASTVSPVYFIDFAAAGMQSLSSAIPPKIDEKQLIFIPVNDNATENVGGTHWSLLVYYRPGNVFYYYDSLSSSNERHARQAADRLLPLFDKRKGPTSIQELALPPRRCARQIFERFRCAAAEQRVGLRRVRGGHYRAACGPLARSHRLHRHGQIADAERGRQAPRAVV